LEKKKNPTNTVGSGSSHFSMEETIAFLNTMEEILPFSDLEWQIVVNLHNNNHGLTCSKELLQRKFNKLRNTNIPTGDPHCPADVRLAKKVAQLMVQKSNAVDLEEEPAVDKAGNDNLSVSDICPDYSGEAINYDNSFCNVTPVAKTDQRNNSRGCPPSIAKSNGIIEMMHLQGRIVTCCIQFLFIHGVVSMDGSNKVGCSKWQLRQQQPSPLSWL
jgi:hypothetical protein